MQPSIEGVPSPLVVMRSGVGHVKHALESTWSVKLFQVPLLHGKADAALQKNPRGLYTWWRAELSGVWSRSTCYKHPELELQARIPFIVDRNLKRDGLFCWFGENLGAELQLVTQLFGTKCAQQVGTAGVG